MAGRDPHTEASACPNGPDEHGEWPCNPVDNGDGTATCSECGFVGDARSGIHARELLDDLRECGEHPLSYGQETHGELHLEAVAALEQAGRALEQERHEECGLFIGLRCAECGRLDGERLQTALKRIEHFPYDVEANAESDLLAVKEIARAALAGGGGAA